MLIGLGATALVGCDGRVTPARVVEVSGVAGIEPEAMSAPSAAPSIEAPGVDLRPRGDRVAVGAAGVGQLRADGLWVRGPDGGKIAEYPLEQGYGLVALPDGALLALGRSGGKDVALRVKGQVETHPVLVVTGELPLGLLPEPGLSDAFWVLWPDRSTAYRTTLVEKYGRLDISATVKLDNAAQSDVVALSGGDLLFAAPGGLRRVNTAGVESRITWENHEVVERLALAAGEKVWALDRAGGLRLVDLGSGATTHTVALSGLGVALAADSHGVAALTATRPPGGDTTWTLSVLDAAGAPAFHVDGAGDPPRGLVLSSDLVVLGDGGKIQVWKRESGTPLFSEG